MNEFLLDDDEYQCYLDWVDEHRLECLCMGFNDIGGDHTFHFAPTKTSLGIIKYVTCSCSPATKYYLNLECSYD